MLVSRINDLEYDIKDKHGSSYHVNLATKFCNCFSFQSLLIPSPHAIAAAIKEKTSNEALVSDFYTVKTIASAYAKIIVLISTDVKASGLTIEGVGEAVQIFPPASRRPPEKGMLVAVARAVDTIEQHAKSQYEKKRNEVDLALLG
ncbi:hypothetical protein Bca101_019608 [Brassica carinata]